MLTLVRLNFASPKVKGLQKRPHLRWHLASIALTLMTVMTNQLSLPLTNLPIAYTANGTDKNCVLQENQNFTTNLLDSILQFSSWSFPSHVRPCELFVVTTRTPLVSAQAHVYKPKEKAPQRKRKRMDSHNSPSRLEPSNNSYGISLPSSPVCIYKDRLMSKTEYQNSDSSCMTKDPTWKLPLKIRA